MMIDISHDFNLSDMKPGDWFLGCRQCSFQLPPLTAAYPECPECGKWLSILNVTEEDKK